MQRADNGFLFYTQPDRLQQMPLPGFSKSWLRRDFFAFLLRGSVEPGKSFPGPVGSVIVSRRWIRRWPPGRNFGFSFQAAKEFFDGPLKIIHATERPTADFSCWSIRRTTARPDSTNWSWW